MSGVVAVPCGGEAGLGKIYPATPTTVRHQAASGDVGLSATYYVTPFSWYGSLPKSLVVRVTQPKCEAAGSSNSGHKQSSGHQPTPWTCLTTSLDTHTLSRAYWWYLFVLNSLASSSNVVAHSLADSRTDFLRESRPKV